MAPGAAAPAAFAAAAAPAAAASAAPAPTLDFDIGGAAQASAPPPDLTLDLDAVPKAEDTGLDFDVSGVTQKKDVIDETVVARSAVDKTAAMDFKVTRRSPRSNWVLRHRPAAAP